MTIGIIEDDSLLNQALEIALQNAGYYNHICTYKKKKRLTYSGKRWMRFSLTLVCQMEMESSCIRNYKWRKEFRQFFLTARDEEKENAAGI